MRPQSLLFRLTATTAITGLLLGPTLPTAALAQPAPPLAAAAQQDNGDPPMRVGRVALVDGTVSFHTEDAEQWAPATLNYPVTSGNTFWTEPNAQTELQIEASRIDLAGGTEFQVGLLDQTGLQATQSQGEIYLHLRGIEGGEAWSVQTPRGLVTLAGDGRYAIDAGDTQTPTTVTVLEGRAQVSGPDLALQVGPGQTAALTGTDSFQGSVGPARQDAFIAAMLQRERPAPAVAPPPVVATMPGGADLAGYGTWSQAPEYGQVWYPRVANDWVPYREGHWAWVAPWGWTWVEREPWGFAPFHYGRWVQIGGRWGWTPGVVAVSARPVYAPALVTFFGVAAGVGLGAALASGSVGWCPLGPREPYRPWYRASDRYVREVNVRHVTNITTINRTVTVNNFVNRRAVTVVPASIMQGSRPVRPGVQQVDPRMLTAAHPMVGRPPVAPTRATFGVTPGVARHTALAPAPPGATSAWHAAPGPAFHPAAARAASDDGAMHSGAPPRPALYNPQQHPPGGSPPGQPPAARNHAPSPGIAATPQYRNGTPAEAPPFGSPGGATDRARPEGDRHTPPLAPHGGGRPMAEPGDATQAGSANPPRSRFQPGGPNQAPHPPGMNPGAPPLAPHGGSGPAPLIQQNERPQGQPGAIPPPAAPRMPTQPTAPSLASPHAAAPPAMPRIEHPSGQAPGRDAGSRGAPPAASPFHPPAHPQSNAPPPAPQYRAPQPAAQFHAAPPQQPVHAAPPQIPAPQAPQMHAAPPQVHTSQPPQMRAAPPQVQTPQPPQLRAAPPPQVHAPPPQAHAAPPPPHAAPAQHAPPQQDHRKRPGEP